MDFLTLLTSSRLAVALGPVGLALTVRLALQRRHRRPTPRRLDEATLATEYVPVGELRRSRLFIYVRREQMGGDTPDHVVVAGYYFGTDEFYAVQHVPLRALSDWNEGTVAIQDAFPEMPFADRHFIGTGGKFMEYPGN